MTPYKKARILFHNAKENEVQRLPLDEGIKVRQALYSVQKRYNKTAEKKRLFKTRIYDGGIEIKRLF